MTMGMNITPLRRVDIPELSQFLVRGFGVAETASLFSHEVLSWKYFDGPGNPSEDSTCSLVARKAGRIVGHVGMCPRQFIVPGNAAASVSAMHAIDWLGSAAHPGAGSLLMLQAFKTSKVQYAVGGSAQAQALLPRLGFEQKPTLAVIRKVLAPLHRLRAPGQGLFRKWAGAAKDVLSASRARTPPAPQSVELRPALAFTEEVGALLRQSSLRLVTCQRDHLLLNYMLRYPGLGFSGWTIHTRRRMIGFAVLKITPHGRIRLGKIVDCWLDAEGPSCWQAAVAAALLTASAPFLRTMSPAMRPPRAYRRHCSATASPNQGKETCTFATRSNPCPETFLSHSRCLMPMAPYSSFDSRSSRPGRAFSGKRRRSANCYGPITTSGTPGTSCRCGPLAVD